MQFDLETHEHGQWQVLAVTGEIDVATAPRMREAIIDMVNRGDRRIIVDLEAVDFMDSTGLGVLVGALKRVRTHEGSLRVVCTNSRVLKVFEITGLDAVFEVASSVEEAAG